MRFLSKEWAEEVLRQAYEEFSDPNTEPEVTGIAVISYHHIPLEENDCFWMSYQMERGALVEAQYGFDRESMPRNAVITVSEDYATAEKILREEISFLGAVRTGKVRIQGSLPVLIRYRNMCHRMIRVKQMDGRVEWD